MKNRLTKAALALSLLSMPALSMADEYNSLVAIEGGASNVSADTTVGGQMYDIQKSKLGFGGLKVGAQGENFRVFLSGRYYNTDGFDKLNTLGAEVEYHFHFSKPVSFFVSANAGKAFMKVANTVNYPSVSQNTYYFGGGAGLNLTVSSLVDVSAGVRFMDLDNTLVQGTTSYKFNSITAAYASIVFKYQMD